MAGPVTDSFALVGTLFAGRFAIETAVAEGGFGVVYRARQQGLGRAVAVKVLKLHAEVSLETRQQIADSFRREAQVVADLSHPAIVQVLDFGVSETPSGVTAPWMAMEWLDGETLGAWIEARRARGGVSPREALELLAPAFDALHEAHARGVAHRDLKPANLMCVRTARGAVRVKVLDFGIARIMQPDEAAGSGETRTQSSFAPFSPTYAAPEQVSRARTGPWTDVHALGLILTELLTGFRPYAGTDLTEIAAATLSPVRPTPARWRVDVGPWEAALVRALALRPAERFPDAGAFHEALATTVDAATRAGAAAPEPPPTPPTTPARARPSRLMWAGLAALGAVSIGAGGGLVSRRLRPTPAAPVTVVRTPTPTPEPPAPRPAAVPAAPVAPPPAPEVPPSQTAPETPAVLGARDPRHRPGRAGRTRSGGPAHAAAEVAAPPPPSPVVHPASTGQPAPSPAPDPHTQVPPE
ncbi:MAG: serine/threonine-protein kinase [Polyangiales bacterium]